MALQPYKLFPFISKVIMDGISAEVPEDLKLAFSDETIALANQYKQRFVEKGIEISEKAPKKEDFDDEETYYLLADAYIMNLERKKAYVDVYMNVPQKVGAFVIAEYFSNMKGFPKEGKEKLIAVMDAIKKGDESDLIAKGWITKKQKAESEEEKKDAKKEAEETNKELDEKLE